MMKAMVDDQSRRFAEIAHAIGADDETAFHAKLAVIARPKPKVDVLELPKVQRAWENS